MGCIALVGENDGNRGAAEKTVDLLEDEVRTVECRIEPGIGHEFCRKLMPYYYYWLKVMDGRFEPGVDMSFDWKTNPDRATPAAADAETGAMLYFYSEDDTANVETKRVQNEVFFDRYVRHFGERVVPVKLERKAHAELFDSFRLDETPAIAILDRKGRKVKTLEGKKITANSLAKYLRKVAKDKSMPDR